MPVLPWTENLFWRTLRQKGYCYEVLALSKKAGQRIGGGG